MPTLRDKAISATGKFLGSLVGVTFDEAGECRDWKGVNFLQAAVDACKKLAEAEGTAAGVALYMTLLEMYYHCHDHAPVLDLHNGEVWVGMNPVSDVRRLLAELREEPREKVPMTDGQKTVWDALDGEALSGKELASELDTSEDTIRQHVHEMRKHGWMVLTLRGRGYYRPDAPPAEMMKKTTPA